MVEDGLLSIGKAAAMSGVSPKTLRYYEGLGLITPKYIDEYTNYRYYDKETLLLIPMIKYYQQIGLSLKRIKDLISFNGCSNHYKYLQQRKSELEKERQQLLISMTSIDDWLQLIIEGEIILQNKLVAKGESNISLKYYKEEKSYHSIKQPYYYNYKESIVNIEWTRFLEERQLEVSGPVILKYDSFHQKMSGEIDSVTVLQHVFPESEEFGNFGGFLGLSCYHVGSFDNIQDTYNKMIMFADRNKYKLKEECYERHVIDYWVTQNENEFVTEIVIPVINQDFLN